VIERKRNHDPTPLGGPLHAASKHIQVQYPRVISQPDSIRKGVTERRYDLGEHENGFRAMVVDGNSVNIDKMS